MCIRKRANKKSKNGYVYEVIIHYDDNGVRKQHTKSGFITKKEAQMYEDFKRAEMDEEINMSNGVEKTLLEVLDEFIAVGGIQYQANTIYNTKKDVHYFEKELGYLKIKEIDYKTLQVFFNNRSKEGIETNKNIRKSLNRIFMYAVRCDYIKSNPIQYVIVTGEEREKNKSTLNEKDFKNLLNEIKEKHDFRYDSYYIAVELGYYTGLRISEVLALEKNDFNFESDVINIEKKLVFKGLKQEDYYSTKQMKSKKSKAIIPLPLVLKEDIQEWFKRNLYDIVVCDEEGKYINPTSLSNALKSIAKRNGINFNFHMLRHTYATNLISHDVDVKIAQELLRHSNYNTTLSIYTHIKDDYKKDVVNNVFR